MKGPDDTLAFHVMAKPIGPKCNLDCTYCFYLEKEKLYPERSDWRMSDEVLESFIRQKIEANDVPQVGFAWQGGEPTLLGVDYFRKIVELQERYANGKTITNALQTNGILIDEAWCHFLRENNFLVGLSIDGPRKFHDRYRINRGGGPSFDLVMRGLEHMKRLDVHFNTLTVVQRHNAAFPLEVYRFLREIGSGYMQFIPVVERMGQRPSAEDLALVSPQFTGEAAVTEWSVEPLQYGRFLWSIYDEWVRRDVGRVYVQLFDVALEAWSGMEPSLCVFAETCGNALAIEHNGDLYSCDHFVYPENRLGNIMDEPIASLVASPQQRTFGTDKQETLPQYCRDCSVRFACNGECPKHRFILTPDNEPGLNYLCEGYKFFFGRIDVTMRFMAEQLRRHQAPADVMQWLPEQERTVQGRNGICYCGSGRKYKLCHGE